MRMAAHATFGGGSLSPDLEGAAARRLGALALVVAGLTVTMGTIELVGGVPSALDPFRRGALMVVAVAISLALHAAIRRGRVSARGALGLGIVYQAVQALLSAVAFHAMARVPGVEVRGWTPVAVWILVYPLIVPGRTRRVVAASLLTAAMDPLGLWLAVVAGAPAPPAAALGRIFLSTALAAILVPVAARFVYGMALEVKRAREMGSYRLVEKLGEGGMGEVWRAEHRMLARGAAIKLIRPAALGAPTGSHAGEMMKRFEREAQATAGLRSPHTIEVYDYGIAADGTFHYVMELLDGFSLQTLVERFGPVPPERVVRFLRQACHSLAEAHAAGLVHRDVKPANLYVCRYGLDVDFLKVLDFGLVKLEGSRAGDAEELTVEGAFTGTPAYMPPEVALGGEVVDGRADIYALGCVAYWLLTGRLVFDSATPMQMVIDHVRTPPLAPSRRAKQPIPEGLERIILRCLAKDPARRPASAAALSRELQWLGIEGRWTDARAREWWKTHDGMRVAEASAVDLSTLETRSMRGRVKKANEMKGMEMKSMATSRSSLAAYLFVAGLAAGAGPASAQEVNVQYDEQADFSRCTTYAWAAGQPAQNPLADKNIVAAIGQALASKGWQKVDRDPACLVRYQASVREDKSLQVLESPRPFFRGIASVDVKTVLSGMLVVDIADAAKQDVIWRAVARDTVSDKPEKNEKKLAKAMEKMFGAFPPEPAR